MLLSNTHNHYIISKHKVSVGIRNKKTMCRNFFIFLPNLLDFTPIINLLHGVTTPFQNLIFLSHSLPNHHSHEYINPLSFAM